MISLHDFVTDFVAVISSQSEGLGKMALGIVKIGLGSPFSANRRCSRSVCLRSVVVDPEKAVWLSESAAILTMVHDLIRILLMPIKFLIFQTNNLLFFSKY